MTFITVYKKNKKVVGFKCYGHTGFAESGCDILCSAISTLAQTTGLAIKEIAGIEVDLMQDDDNVSYEVYVKDCTNEKSDVIFGTFILGVKELQKNYNKYISLKFVKLEGKNDV